MIDEIQGLPASAHTETAILGAMMLSGDEGSQAINDALGKLTPEDFALDSHQRIYRCVRDMVGCEIPVYLTTVRTELEKRRELDAVGGPGYLVHLTEGIPRHLSIESYVATVKDKSLLRQLAGIFHDGQTRAMDQSEDALDVLGAIEARLSELAQRAVIADFQSVEEIVGAQPNLDEFLEGGPGEGHIFTGFDFDKWTHGLKGQQLVIVAARPSMGKTAWAINVACNVALRREQKVGILTLEMSKEELLRRMVASESGISTDVMANKAAGKDGRAAINDALERLIQSRIFIDDKPFTTLQEIRAKARRLKHKHGLDLLIVDYLGLIEPPSGKRENRTQDVSAISRGLKGLAKEMEIPIIALCQLNRSCEMRNDKRPQLSDLRDSGSIEQDADIVAFIYREEVYDKENPDVKGLAEFIVAKQRNGRIGVLPMAYNAAITRFSDMAHEVPYA